MFNEEGGNVNNKVYSAGRKCVSLLTGAFGNNNSSTKIMACSNIIFHQSMLQGEELYFQWLQGEDLLPPLPPGPFWRVMC